MKTFKLEIMKVATATNHVENFMFSFLIDDFLALASQFHMQRSPTLILVLVCHLALRTHPDSLASHLL